MTLCWEKLHSFGSPAEWKKWFLCESVPTGKTRSGLRWDRYRERRVEAGNAFRLPPPTCLSDSCCGNRNLYHVCLPQQQAAYLHTWGTPSPPISHLSRNSNERFHHCTTNTSFIVLYPARAHIQVRMDAMVTHIYSHRHERCRWCTQLLIPLICNWLFSLSKNLLSLFFFNGSIDLIS